MEYDVAIMGAGPAGSVCAAFCAAAGLRTLVLERARFPREKVCGDCLNPACWPILDRLALSDRVRALPHSNLSQVEFITRAGHSLRIPIPTSSEIALKRSLLDQLLLTRAEELGAHILQDHPLDKLEPGWTIHSRERIFRARTLVAADGRNSTVARQLGIFPNTGRDRIGLQTHFPAPEGFGAKVSLQFMKHGYCGLASVGADQLNLCLAAPPAHIDDLKSWAHGRFKLGNDQIWRTITPLSRKPISPAHDQLLLVGDAARVVEPFTGEGIYYAMASGELAARHLSAPEQYAQAHRRLYRGRLWINDLSRLAATHPWVAGSVLGTARFFPGALRLLTHKVIKPA